MSVQTNTKMPVSWDLDDEKWPDVERELLRLRGAIANLVESSELDVELEELGLKPKERSGCTKTTILSTHICRRVKIPGPFETWVCICDTWLRTPPEDE